MVALKCSYLLLFIFNVCNGQRKISGGYIVTSYKRYVVYLVKAEISLQFYDEWLCGGALVSTEYVITSAACVEDVQHIYVIAGYNKYVPSKEIDHDPCTKAVKKKVIYTCVPKEYDFDYARADKWSYIDIALVKVESPYNLQNPEEFKLCTYVPAVIRINYELKYQMKDIDVLIFGWGHIDKWRQTNDTQDYNQEYLRYASTLILDKEDCKASYKSSNMSKVIDNYMICTFGPGNLDENGSMIVPVFGSATGCDNPTTRASRALPEVSSSETLDLSSSEIDDSLQPIFRTGRRTERTRTETEGICQNDHGGPLITWAGTEEVLLGVASVFKVDQNNHCTGPYLYTSTQCNGKFLACILGSTLTLRALNYGPELCLQPPQLRGYDTYEKHISWINHPDGPADNEKNASTTTATTANATNAPAATTVNATKTPAATTT